MNINITTKCIPTYDGIRNCWHHGMDEYGVSGFCRSIKNVSFKQEPATPEVALTQEPGIPVDLSDAVAAGAEIEKLLSGYIGRDIPISVSLLKRALGIPQAQPRGPKGIPFGQHLTCSQCGGRCTDHHVDQRNGNIWCPSCVMKETNPDWLPQAASEEAPAGDGSEADERDPWANP